MTRAPNAEPPLLELTVDKAGLQRLLNGLNRVVPRISTASLAFQGLWLRAEDGLLSGSVTNGDLTLMRRIPAEQTRPGAGTDADVVLPIKVLLALVRRLPQGQVRLLARDGALEIEASGFQGQLQLLRPDEVSRPAEPAPSAVTVTLSHGSLADGYGHVALALGHFHGWDQLQGVELTLSSDSVSFVATDLTQLARVTIPVTGSSVPPEAADRSIVSPSSALNDLARLTQEMGDVVVRIGERQVDYDSAGSSVRVARLRGPYPDYPTLLTAPRSRRVELDRQELLAAIDRTSLLAHNSIGVEPSIWWWVRDDEIVVSTRHSPRGEALERCPATVEGDPCEIGFRLWSIHAMLRRLQGSRLVLELGRPDKPTAIFTTERPGYRYHILPLAVPAPPSRLAGAAPEMRESAAADVR